MSEQKEKKPFYKQAWWIVLLLVIIIVGKTTGIFDKEDTVKDKAEPVEEVNNNDDENNTDNEPTDNNNDNDEENTENNTEEEKRIKIDETLEFEHGKVNIKLDGAYLEDGKLRVPFWWNHWASNDKVQLEYFMYPVITQDGNELEYEDKSDKMLRQTAKGVDSHVELIIDLDNDKPVELKFKTMQDDPEEHSVTIELQ